MSLYFATVRSVVEAEGGVVEKFIGDAAMAVFGLYRAREDDATRAVRAALAMLAGLEELNVELQATHGVTLQMRVGVDTGEMVVTGMAEREAKEFLVVGETANRAARLQAAARPGTVLLSADTTRQVAGQFGLRRVPGLQLKGIDGTVDAYVVVAGDREGYWPETRGVEGVVTRTIGREQQLRQLQDAFAAVVSERARRIVTVLGEAGVGKSRLVHDVDTWLARLPSNVWVLRGRASPSTENVPNALLRSVFAERLGIRATDGPEQVRTKWREGWAQLLDTDEIADGAPETVATWLGFTVGEEGRRAVATLDPESLRRRGSGLVLRLLDRLAERAPVVVLLEDLHWADSASMDSLEALASAPGGGPLLVLATARPVLLEQRPTWGRSGAVHTRLGLDPLSDDDARSLVAEILQRADDVPPSLVDLVVRTADGNPYYVEELVKWLVEEGVVDTSADRWQVAARGLRSVRVPTTLRGLLQARLDSLEVSERAVIGGAAVVGRVFWDQAVARLATSLDEPVRSSALDHLAAREVVFPRPHSTFSGSREFSFRHALMRDVAYEGVLRSVRRRHHAVAAQWLEEAVALSQRPDEHAADVAHHHEEAGHPAAAARWYLRAGQHAASTFAGEDALRLLGRARSLVPKGERDLWADVLLAKEAVLDRMGRREEQRETLDELGAEDALDPARKALVRLAEGRWLFFRGEYPAVPPVAEEAAALARRGGPARPGVRRPDAGRPEPGLRERARPGAGAAGPGAGHGQGARRPQARRRGAAPARRRRHQPWRHRGGHAAARRRPRRAPADQRPRGRGHGRRPARRAADELGPAGGGPGRVGGGARGVRGHRPPLPRGGHAHQPRPHRDGAGPAGRRPGGRPPRAAADRGDRRRRGRGGLAAEPGRRVPARRRPQHRPGVPGAGAGGEPPARPAVLHRAPARLAGRGRPGRRPPRRRGRARRRGPGGRREGRRPARPRPRRPARRHGAAGRRRPGRRHPAAGGGQEARRARRRGRLAGEPLGARARPRGRRGAGPGHGRRRGDPARARPVHRAGRRPAGPGAGRRAPGAGQRR